MILTPIAPPAAPFANDYRILRVRLRQPVTTMLNYLGVSAILGGVVDGRAMVCPIGCALARETACIFLFIYKLPCPRIAVQHHEAADRRGNEFQRRI
jgi:hypothetical protein